MSQIRRASDSIIFSVLIGLSYFLHSLKFHGPAYLSDEIAYLGRAVVASGNTFETRPGGWHAGYSLLIAPIFAVTDSPQAAWVGVIALNSLMWSVSFFVGAMILRQLFPDASRFRFNLSLIVAGFYPTWISMTGYAFSTPAIAMFALLSLWLLIKSELKPNRYLLLFVACVGFMFWIHTLGLAFALSAIGLLLAQILLRGKVVSYLALISVLVVVASSYQAIVHPWFLSEITSPRAINVGHYRTGGIASSLATRSGIAKWLLAFAGQLGYVVLATFGIAGYALFDCVSRLRLRSRIKAIRGHEEASGLGPVTPNTVDWAIGFYAVSFVGVAAMVSLYLSNASESSNADYLMYGRHLDSLMLPLFGIGFLTDWTFKKGATLAGVVLLTGLGFGIYESKYEEYAGVNSINVIGLWPQLVRSDVDPMGWFILGAFGVLLATLLVRFAGKTALIAVLPVFVLTSRHHSDYHQSILARYSSESGFQQLIEDNYTQDSCVGMELVNPYDLFDPGRLRARARLQLFYLYSYDIREVSIEEWYENCSGPFLTPYEDRKVSGGPLTYVGREKSSGLFVVVKAEQAEGLKFADDDNLFVSEANSCIQQGCYAAEAADLRRFMLVGDFTDGQLVTTGEYGYLFFGPFSNLNAGTYRLRIDMEVSAPGSQLEVQAYSVEHKDLTVETISPYSEYLVTVPSDATEFQVRMLVADDTQLTVSEYSLETGTD